MARRQKLLDEVAKAQAQYENDEYVYGKLSSNFDMTWKKYMLIVTPTPYPGLELDDEMLYFNYDDGQQSQSFTLDLGGYPGKFTFANV